MPTIADLVDSGAIIKIDVELAPRDQPLRLLYGTPPFVEWLQELLGGAGPSRLFGHPSPAEQIDDLSILLMDHPFTPEQLLLHTIDQSVTTGTA